MLRIGKNCGIFDAENFRVMAQSGLTDIEISLAMSKHVDLDLPAIKKLADDHGINIWSYHLPFGPVDISSRDLAFRLTSVAYWKEIINKAAQIGIDKFVLHPSLEPKSEDPELRRQEIENAKESLNTLAEYAANWDAVIAVEDLPRGCLGRSTEEMAELISANDKLRVCFDTNHLLVDNNLNFVEKLGDKIVTLHVSDYDFTDEKHWLPGEGKNDWQAIYRKLREKGYNGVWMYEVSLSCPKTLVRERDLTYADFYRNAMEVFEDRPFTVLGKPVE